MGEEGAIVRFVPLPIAPNVLIYITAIIYIFMTFYDMLF